MVGRALRLVFCSLTVFLFGSGCSVGSSLNARAFPASMRTPACSELASRMGAPRFWLYEHSEQEMKSLISNCHRSYDGSR